MPLYFSTFMCYYYNILLPMEQIFDPNERGKMAVNSKIKDGNLDKLFEAILTLENVEECYAFFEDLCTVPELKAMSQRYVVATMLNDKRVYSDIVSETGASTATISRVNRSLIYGCDGYELVFERLKNK